MLITEELRDELVEKLTHVIDNTSETGRIWQLDNDKNVLRTYRTAKEAEVCTGIKGNNISMAINSCGQAGGFYWLRNKDLVM